MKVLIAEDDATTRLMLIQVLGQWGYEVAAVNRGDEAVSCMAASDAPKLVILDRGMPGLEGVDVCRAIRSVETQEPPYVILLTGQKDAKSVVEGLEAGANDYIAKPYDVGELRARLKVGQRVIELQAALVKQVRELQQALAHIKVLQGILPICMYCHKIRSDEQSWQRIERYIAAHSDAQFSHAICPDCLAKHHPELADEPSSRGTG